MRAIAILDDNKVVVIDPTTEAVAFVSWGTGLRIRVEALPSGRWGVIADAEDVGEWRPEGTWCLGVTQSPEVQLDFGTDDHWAVIVGSADQPTDEEFTFMAQRFGVEREDDDDRWRWG